MPNSVRRKKVPTTVYLLKDQREQLKDISERTGESEASLIRRGIDMLLRKERVTWSGIQRLVRKGQADA